MRRQIPPAAVNTRLAAFSPVKNFLSFIGKIPFFHWYVVQQKHNPRQISFVRPDYRLQTEDGVVVLSHVMRPPGKTKIESNQTGTSDKIANVASQKIHDEPYKYQISISAIQTQSIREENVCRNTFG